MSERNSLIIRQRSYSFKLSGLPYADISPSVGMIVGGLSSFTLYIYIEKYVGLFFQLHIYICIYVSRCTDLKTFPG